MTLKNLSENQVCEVIPCFQPKYAHILRSTQQKMLLTYHKKTPTLVSLLLSLLIASTISSTDSDSIALLTSVQFYKIVQISSALYISNVIFNFY